MTRTLSQMMWLRRVRAICSWVCRVFWERRDGIGQKGFKTASSTIAISSNTGSSLNQRYQTWL